MPERVLIELLYGRSAHASTLACVEDVPFSVVVHLAEGFPHSIWQLVSHINFWMAYELKRIAGQQPPYPVHASESWPTQTQPPSEAAWQRAVALLRELLAELEKLAASPSETLAREVSPTHPSHTKHASSTSAVLWQTLVHNSYHIGQIAMLRRTFAAWPPKTGGDTW